MTQRNMIDYFDLQPITPRVSGLSAADMDVELVDLEELPDQVRDDVARSRSEIEQGDYLTIAQLKARLRPFGF